MRGINPAAARKRLRAGDGAWGFDIQQFYREARDLTGDFCFLPGSRHTRHTIKSVPEGSLRPIPAVRTLDMGGWLALTQPGLSPGKMRQAYLGAITPKLRDAPLAVRPLERSVIRRFERLLLHRLLARHATLSTHNVNLKYVYGEPPTWRSGTHQNHQSSLNSSMATGTLSIRQLPMLTRT